MAGEQQEPAESGGSGVSSRRPWIPGERSTTRGILATFGILVGFLLASFPASIAESLLDGIEDEGLVESYAATIGQLVGFLVIVVITWRVGWLQLTRLTTRIEWSGLLTNRTAVLACLIPAVGLLLGEPPPTDRVVAFVFDYATTGMVEELGDRMFPTLFLAFAWRSKTDHTRRAVVVTGLLWGLLHFNPIILVLGPFFALAFVKLTLDTNSIWPAVVLHAAFDFLTEFPADQDGISNSWPSFVAVTLVVASGVIAWRRLAAMPSIVAEYA